MRFVTLALVALLALVHVELWFGKGGVPRDGRAAGQARRAEGDQRARRGTATSSSRPRCSDLKEGLEMVEEKARFELGMIKPDEIFVQLSTPRR